MNLNFDLIASSFPLLLAGAAITVEITALSVGFGLLIGCMVGIARLCNVKALRYLANIYVDFIRGTPLLVQIFLVYFALPGIIGSRVDPFFAAISACSINSGAYIAEIFRAGIQSIDQGQMEAGRAIGLGWIPTMTKIIIPQAVKNIIPAIGNELIALLKETSIVSMVGSTIGTLTFDLNAASNTVFRDIPNFLASGIIAGCFYLVIVYLLVFIIKIIERRLRASDKR